VHDHQTGGRREVLPPIHMIFNPPMPVHQHSVAGGPFAPRLSPRAPFLSLPPPPGLINPGPSVQTPVAPQQSRSLTEGSCSPPIYPVMAFIATTKIRLTGYTFSLSYIYNGHFQHHMFLFAMFISHWLALMNSLLNT